MASCHGMQLEHCARYPRGTSPRTALGRCAPRPTSSGADRNKLSICIREQDSGQNPLLMTTRFEQFHGTAWSRMRGFNGMTEGEVRSVVNGVISILKKGDARTANPIRLFEQGLVSQNIYVRIFLWVTAIDGILMAVKEGLFVSRLSALLGAGSRVFPPEDGVYITRPTVVGDVAADLFVLRSEIAWSSHTEKVLGSQGEPEGPLASPSLRWFAAIRYSFGRSRLVVAYPYSAQDYPR